DEEEPPAGCVPAADGFQADGILAAGEPGIEGVLVQLGAGACPAVGLDEMVTDGNGRYAFTGLPAGTYCLTIDALSAPNDEILLPGSWSAPNENGSTAVTLAEGETRDDLNFGWDYQFLPVPDVDQTACTRSFTFVEDVTVPDDTTFTPGDSFVKTWRLQNSGTCPWIEGFSLVFVGGDQLDGPDSAPLTAVVAPGQTIDVSVELTAPETIGTFRSNWQLADAEGNPFGVGGLIEEAIYVQIVSAIAEPTPEPGTAMLGGLVWSDFCSLNDDGTTSGACVETEEGSGLFIANGSYQFGEQVLADIEVTLSQGACPDGGAIPESSVLNRTLTDADGLYRFPNMNAGTYCISINAFNPQNVNALIPGDWTWPARGVPWFTAVLDPGEQFIDIDFGWDHSDD
ncbi:MAG: NBR1-Ig-like domain-containing protein, partial [Anaerolineae bacterium]